MRASRGWAIVLVSVATAIRRHLTISCPAPGCPSRRYKPRHGPQAVLLGVAAAALGWEWADPVVGLLITVAILAVLRQAARDIPGA